ncbi:NAD(P)-dependent iron-only hydrogenase iron-sulfur protein [Clostridium aceticum]|uniref:NAD(P)-dependent iron-only hydrogenase iron-sulfur protein n=1 Tax=Clostridium aceticum TaxID=84022 RepID=A0A0D8I929_9CLOT|nr:(2Fe-2S) ferredoxin domain-containing protein [Clostridium aceticum]AKL97005.1 NAD(P)-dependent iron-only hydrogenase iron-sulfur protein [Clostridium aceticum]KJF25741.1 ferredoxin [Clostridium aceticum]
MKSIAELQKIRQEALDRVNLRRDKKGTRIVVFMGTCGIAAGARPVLMALLEEVKARNLSDIVVTQAGCKGVCRLEPTVEVYKEDEEKVTYVYMTPDKARRVIVDHIVNGKVIDAYAIGAYAE